LGFANFLDDIDEKRYFQTVLDLDVALPTVRTQAEKLFKLSITKQLDRKLVEARHHLERVTGDESLSEILGIVENPIFEFTTKINDGVEEGPTHIALGGREWLEDLIANPRETIGVPTPFPRYNELIGGGYRRGEVAIVGARRKTGKAQTLDSPVYTPMGPIRMGDISIGDQVSTPSGGVATVRSIHPQGPIPIYRVVFGDGDSTECSLDHLWEVRHCKKSKKEVLTLGEIVQRGLRTGKERKWTVELPIWCEYHAQEIPLDPYLIGLILGNGGLSTNAVRFTSADSDTIHLFKSLLPKGDNLVYLNDPDRPYDYEVRGGVCRNILSRLGLMRCNSHHKFIPSCCLHNSKEVRLALLQGLCDTDGSADKRGYVLEYSTVSKRLAENIKELVQSLGGLVRITPRLTTCQTGTFPSYRLTIKHNDRTQFFRLERKKMRMRMRTKPNLHRTIERVEYIGIKEAQCIKLSTDDGLYMTNHHIVTHNTIWCDNVCLHVAKELNIPVLNIDTEMNREQHLARIIAHMTNINSLLISKGKLTSSQADDCRRAMELLESIPYTYHCVVGRSFEEQVASMRRWSIKTVGVDSSGRRNDCLVVHDYLKMMDEASAGKFQEYEKLGYNMIAMHSMATRCDIPVLSMVQLNREGGIAASDRITWFCSSYSTLSRKVEGEGDMECLKLIIDASRNGGGSLDGDHINIHFDGATARMVEGKTRYELERERQLAKTGMIVEDDDDAECTFTEAEFQTVPEQRRPKRTRKQAR
jgi:replicative DNA helicase